MARDNVQDLVESLQPMLKGGWAQGRRAFNHGRKVMRSFSKDDILDSIGLQRQTVGTWLGPLAIGLGVGALIGAAVALMVAPRPGIQLREDLLERGRKIMNKGKEGFGATGSSSYTPST
jgi:hypothetical protein